MTITSRAFEHNGQIPPQYTCTSEGVNPPLHIEDISAEAKTLVLVMEDIDSVAGVWDHWLVYNMPVNSEAYYIEEASEPEGFKGRGTSGDLDYFGPCPKEGTHRYVFKVYAINTILPLEEGATKAQVMQEIQGKIVEEAELIGLYTQMVTRK
jgi:Raf kinase inhibitor-like YbhB/YbcL family protein